MPAIGQEAVGGRLVGLLYKANDAEHRMVGGGRQRFSLLYVPEASVGKGRLDPQRHQ